jgi:hypothetical protein
MGEREGEPERGERTEGLRGVREQLQEVVLASKRQAGGGEVDIQEPPRSYSLSQRRRQEHFALGPLAFGVFKNIQNSTPFS